MKVLKYIICVLIILPMTLSAQKANNPTKKYIGKIDSDTYVNHGEFRIDFDNKVIDANTGSNAYTKNYMYLVIVRDRNGKVLLVKTNNYEKMFNNVSGVNILRAGYTMPELVFTDKRSVTYAGKEMMRTFLHVEGRIMGPYDEILDMFPNGFVCKRGEVYSYEEYTENENDVVNYAIPDEALYSEKTIRCNMKDEVLEFKPVDNVRYYKTFNDHYYLLYYDNYMDNTLMVVDSVGYELDGALETVMFKYSQNGNHWIAAYPNNLIVDGVNVKRMTEKIKHVAINNNGQYVFVVEGKDRNDVMYCGDDVLVKGVDVKWLAVDVEDRFNYICRSNNGYFYGIDNELFDKNEDMKNYYYPALFDNNEKFVVKSNDGKHVMEYSYDTPYIMIDDMRLEYPSIPHYAKWSEAENSFIWNAVEGVNLYLYQYKVKK